MKLISIKDCDLHGKNIAITGATGGLGVNVCMHLAKAGANLILINRSMDKSEKLKQQINNIYPSVDVKIVIADLSNFNSVKQAVQILKTMPIDTLILNAGIYNVPRYITDIGYDNVFVTNFVSHYYMVKQLLPILKKSQSPNVVAVGSIAHNYCKLNPNDIDYSTNAKHTKVYGNSKRFLMFGLMGLFKNETNIKFSVVHPGVTFTNITNHYPKLVYALIKYPMKILFPSPKKASLHIVGGVVNSTPYHHWIGPTIMSVWGKPKLTKLKTCNENESKQIFDLAEQIYNKLANN